MIEKTNPKKNPSIKVIKTKRNNWTSKKYGSGKKLTFTKYLFASEKETKKIKNKKKRWTRLTLKTYFSLINLFSFLLGLK